MYVNCFNYDDKLSYLCVTNYTVEQQTILLPRLKIERYINEVTKVFIK